MKEGRKDFLIVNVFAAIYVVRLEYISICREIVQIIREFV